MSPRAYPVLSKRNFKSCGGAEIQQVLISKALCDLGHKCTFVVQDYGQGKCETHDGIEVIRGSFRRPSPRKNWKLPLEIVRLIWLLMRVNADIYLLKDPTYLLFPMGLYRRLFGKKLIKLIASNWDCQKQLRGVSRTLYLLGTKFVDLTIFQTKHQKQVGTETLGLSGRVINNICHYDMPAPVNAERDIDVLWVGTATQNKQPDVFLNIAENMPNSSFTMIIAPGPGVAFNNRVAERAKSIGNLYYLGFVEYSQISSYYSRAKLVVITSESEGFPNVFLQAWQAGTPVVSLGIDPDAVIVHNEVGYVAENATALKKCIRLLLDNQSLREAYGKNCRNYVLREHGKEKIIQQYLEVFKMLL